MRPFLAFLSFCCIVGAIGTFFLLVAEVRLPRRPSRDLEATLLWWMLGFMAASHLLTEVIR